MKALQRRHLRAVRLHYSEAHLSRLLKGPGLSCQRPKVSDFARRRLRSMQCRTSLVSAFWSQAQLPL
ncbi:MAG: hypothetical protein WBO37_13690 [Gammaproteobacteria bacterium]